MVRRGGLAPEPAEIDARTVAGAKPVFAGPPAGTRATVAYFGPDLNDAAVRRRVAQWAYAGFQVFPFAFSRNGTESGSLSEFVNLGSLMPQSLIGRVFPLALAALGLLRQRRRLAVAQVFIGRNLDNALLALFARGMSGSSAPLVYEIFDVNRVCTEPGLTGALLTWIDFLPMSNDWTMSPFAGRIAIRKTWRSSTTSSIWSGQQIATFQPRTRDGS